VSLRFGGHQTRESLPGSTDLSLFTRKCKCHSLLGAMVSFLGNASYPDDFWATATAEESQIDATGIAAALNEIANSRYETIRFSWRAGGGWCSSTTGGRREVTGMIRTSPSTRSFLTPRTMARFGELNRALELVFVFTSDLPIGSADVILDSLVSQYVLPAVN